MTGTTSEPNVGSTTVAATTAAVAPPAWFANLDEVDKQRDPVIQYVTRGT